MAAFIGSLMVSFIHKNIYIYHIVLPRAHKACADPRIITDCLWLSSKYVPVHLQA